MKAIFINAAEQKIESIEIENTNDAIYKTLGYGTNLMEQVLIFENQDVLMVDEEGMFDGHNEMSDGSRFGFLFVVPYSVPLYHWPIHGNGLIFNCDDDGESVDVKSSIEEIKSMVTFKRI
jgi:hypothetical protein